MKSNRTIVRIMILGVILSCSITFAACSGSSSTPTAPTTVPTTSTSASAVIEPSAARSTPSQFSTAALSAAAAATAGPSITTISGYSSSDVGINNGLVAMDSCGTAYNGYRAVNDTRGTFRWSIRGTNFGSTPGTVMLAGQPVTVLSWQATTISIDPVVPWNSGPMSTLLTIRTSTGAQTTKGVNIVPAISTRIFGQCTYGVAYERKKMGLQPSPSAFGGYTGITAGYVPRAGDQFQWASAGGLRHTAIAVSVSGPVKSAGSNVYTLTIAETNVDCRNGFRQFNATFGVIGSIITTPLKHPSLGNASLYYR